MTELPRATPYTWPVLAPVRPTTALALSSSKPAVTDSAAELPSADAATVLPEERRAAREQGYAEGLRQGRDDARSEQAAVLAELQASAHQFIDELRSEQERAGALLRWLLQTLAEELSVQQMNRSPELLDRLLDEAVSDVGLPSQGLVVCVAPGLETWWQENEFRDDVRVQIDEGLAPGTVQLRSPARVAEFNPRALVNRLLSAAPDERAEQSEAGPSPNTAASVLNPNDPQPQAAAAVSSGAADRANDDSQGAPE